MCSDWKRCAEHVGTRDHRAFTSHAQVRRPAGAVDVWRVGVCLAAWLVALDGWFCLFAASPLNPPPSTLVPWPHPTPLPTKQKHFIKLLLKGEELPDKVAESGRGYTLSGEFWP